EHRAAARTLGMGDDDQPDDDGPGAGVEPGLCQQLADPWGYHLRARLQDTTRSARITSRMPPWTLYCQAGATEAKLRSEPESCITSAPSTVPMGEPIQRTNSPPPMMTAPMESSVRPRPTLASPVVVIAAR